MFKNIIIVIGIMSFSLISIHTSAKQHSSWTNNFTASFQQNIDESNITPVDFSTAKDIRTDTLHVEGNCDMCKKRIENAALINGVKKTSWNKHGHQLIVVYDASKTDIDKILSSVAEAGHDNEKYKANKDVYHHLPKCCAYREEGAQIH